ncbi:MAG: ArsR family transcriptional regulator, partial [Pseudomonadota bacterium]
MSLTTLAAQAGISKSACQVRFHRLRSEGYILGFRATLNSTKLGQDHIAFAEVRLTDTTEAALTAFNTAVRRVPEIEECHM